MQAAYRVFGAWLAVTLAIGQCVPLEPIGGAPCPCPDDFACCPTLQTCLRPDDSCPTSLPASSGDACQRDSQCPTGEVCHAWSLPDHGPAGPGECRRDCSRSTACAEGEHCELVLHDGAALQSMNAAQACVADQPIPGCAGLTCSACNGGQLGRTYCAGDDVRGCLVGLHPVCGLTCRSVLILSCLAGRCVEQGGVAKCLDGSDSPPCMSFSCDVCPVPQTPERPGCAADTLLICLTVPSNDPGCDRFCLLSRTPCPSGWTCRADEQTAWCSSE